MLPTCKPTPYCLLVPSCSHICCATWSVRYLLCARVPLSLSGEERILRIESPYALLTTFETRRLRPTLHTAFTFSCDPRSLARLVLLLPIRHAAGDRSPLSPSVYLGDPFKPLDLTSALAGAPVRREQRCALLYAVRVPSSQIMSIVAEVTCEVWPHPPNISKRRRWLKVKGSGGQR